MNDKHWELMQSKGCQVIPAPDNFIDDDSDIDERLRDARIEFAKKKQELRLLALFIKKHSAKSA